MSKMSDHAIMKEEAWESACDRCGESCSVDEMEWIVTKREVTNPDHPLFGPEEGQCICSMCVDAAEALEVDYWEQRCREEWEWD